jgi:hypothetical protein
MNGVDQRKDPGAPAVGPAAGPGAGGAVGKRTLVDSIAGGGVPAAGPAAAGPTAEAGQESEAAAPDVDGAAGAPYVEGTSSKDGPLSKEKAKQVLEDAFGSYKTITEGKVEVLEQAEFQEAYDKIYGETKWSWEKWVKPTHGNLNGFAHDGVNYINKNMANTGTVPHEMLHNNAAADWRPFVGSQFDEGATDVLKQHALKKAGLTSPNSYPDQIKCVEAFLDTGVSKEQLFTAYLKGDAKTIVGEHVDKTCTGSWADVKAAMEAKDWAKAKVKLAKKTK